MRSGTGFYVLGPLTVLHNGRDITPTAPKVRQVLAFLLIRRNQIVQVSELVDELWADNPPDSAMTTLQTYIYKLRKDVLEPTALAHLQTKPSGYLLDVDDENVDVCAFAGHTDEGRAALQRDEPEKAAELLDTALKLWRGKALVGVTTGEILSAHVTRLEEDQLRALEMRIEADMRLGRHQELISELKQLIFTYPLHERFYGDLMTALNHSGRRYEALEVYRRLRERLIDELGLEPSAPLQRLHQNLLCNEVPASVAGPAGSANPAGSARLAGFADEPAGEPDGQVQRSTAGAIAAGTAQAPGAAITTPKTVKAAESDESTPRRRATLEYSGALAVPAQLPPDISDFTGRTEELSIIRKAIAPYANDHAGFATARTISICGMTGVGKTTLALHLAHMDKPHSPDGQLFADLRGASANPARAADVLRDFLRAVGIAPHRTPHTLEELSKLFRTWSSSRRVLIVLDDAASAAQVTALLPASPRCAVIITSRWGLQGLPGVRIHELGTMSTRECVDLLGRITGPDHVRAEPQWAEKIVEQCGHLPLAIRSVGARFMAIRTWNLKKMATLLEEDPSILDQLKYAEYDVRASYDGSYAHLDPRDRSTFRLLSLLPPRHFTASTAAGLLGAPTQAIESQLNRLVGCHLLQATTHKDSDETHYRLHRLTRLYARERLTREYLEPRPLSY